VLPRAQITEAFVVPAGDEGGPLTNGVNPTGTITLADMDMWTFAANTGDAINLHLFTTNFNGKLQLYGPYGALVATAQNSTSDTIAYTANAGGIYTVLVSSYGLAGTGTYGLYPQIPEILIVPRGGLNGSGSYSGSINPGAEDRWTFTACKGDLIHLQLNTTNFNGKLQLYGLNGALLAGAVDSTVLSITYTATNCGAFAVLVSSYFEGGAGTYGFTANGLADQLRLCTPVIAGAALSVCAAGGAPGATFTLLATTNLALPVTNWTPIWTNQFDQFGVFTYSDSFNTSQRQQFYRVHVP